MLGCLAVGLELGGGFAGSAAFGVTRGSSALDLCLLLGGPEDADERGGLATTAGDAGEIPEAEGSRGDFDRVVLVAKFAGDGEVAIEIAGGEGADDGGLGGVAPAGSDVGQGREAFASDAHAQG